MRYIDYEKLIPKIAGRVYKDLGSGHQESVYQKAMEVEFRIEGLKYEPHVTIPITYRKHYVGTSEADIILRTNLIIELKTVKALKDYHKLQLLKYMRMTEIKRGVLVNFPYDNSEPEIKWVYL